MQSTGLSFLVLLFCLANCGCHPIIASESEFKAPEVELPDSWNEQKESAAPLELADETLQVWWRLFDLDDQEIKQVVLANWSLKKSRALIDESLALRGLTRANFLPSIDLNAGLNRGNTQVGLNPLTVSNQYTTLFQLGWELDLFGKTASAYQAAKYEVQASEAGARALELSVISSVIELRVNLLLLSQRLEIAKSNAQIMQENIALVDARMQAGLGTELDVAQAKSQLEMTLASIPALNTLLTQSRLNLNLISASLPGSEQFKFFNLGSRLPTLPDGVISARPAQLLRSRPDIVQAEKLLAANSARKLESLAQFFPTISLGAQAGYLSSSSSNLWRSDSQIWDVAPQLSWNIFAGGRTWQQLKVRDAQFQQQLSEYQQTVLRAVLEVEAAFSDLRLNRERSMALRRAFEASDQALALAKDQFTQGLINFQRVLEIDRQRFQAEDALVISKAEELFSFVRLMKALGQGSVREI